MLGRKKSGGLFGVGVVAQRQRVGGWVILETESGSNRLVRLLLVNKCKHQSAQEVRAIVGGRTQASVGDMGAGNEVEAGSGKFWWRAEMFWRTGSCRVPRKANRVLTFHREKGATAVHLAGSK